ncbi:MAG TPA: lysophospholipid acyltransferase family protein, partial [Nitrospirota bacterium]|nr:lysophospholipid acyltransferase family protein [Nitrospirota bacterium]
AQSILGPPLGIVARPLDNPYLEEFVSRVRTRYGNAVINKTGGMKDVLRTLSSGGTVGILLDQSVKREEGTFVDFFGRPACTNKGLALLAARTKAPVVPVFARRLGPDRHEIVVGDEIPLIETGDRDADISANTQAYTKAIEDFVRRYPDQWFWMHRRWKTKRIDADA